ncbi:MAG: hypothetical protein ABL949_15155 [Fimbriimonadaceae bacterium]
MVAILCASLQDAPLRLKELELPVVAVYREIALGPVERPLEVLGLYVDNYQKMWDEYKRAPINFDNTRIGTSSSRVRKALVGNLECLDIDAEATRTQKLKRPNEVLEFRLRVQRHWYVTPEGRLIAESFRLEGPGCEWTMEATYNKDTYTVVLTSPDRGTRTLGPIHPGMPMEELTGSAFRPMLKLPDQALLKDKEFYLLDPFTGGPVKQSVRLRGPYSGTWDGNRYSGQEFEFKNGSATQIASVTKQGWLIKTLLEKYLYLHLEDKPGS